MMALLVNLAELPPDAATSVVERSAINIAMSEISNGSWFIMSLAMWVTLGLMIAGRVRRIGGVVAFARDLWSQQEIGLQMGVAFFVWLTGSTMRAGYIWLLLASEHSHNAAAIRFAHSLDASYQVMITSAVIAVIGGLCCLRVFGQDDMSYWLRTWTWVATGAAAVVVPIAVHLLLR